jgi:DNA-binding transcriptional MerR regulator
VPPRREPLLTIGQAASYAGVTVRAVRHYHRIGLLREPPRDESGYRRYRAADIVTLIRIRALSQAGVPLSRVGELLKADPGELALAVAEIDASLQAEIERLEQHRKAVAHLATIDGLALPPEIVDYLDKLRSLDLSERLVRLERDGWLLVSVQLPDEVVGWVHAKRAALDDETFVALYRAFDQAYDWSPDDPRLEGLANDLVRLFARLHRNHEDALTQQDDHIDDTIAAMIDANSIGASPALRRLGELIEARGWSGWTNMEPPANQAPPSGNTL